jgi:hypothetical protein
MDYKTINNIEGETSMTENTLPEIQTKNNTEDHETKKPLPKVSGVKIDLKTGKITLQIAKDEE